jgi:Ala-tRNA(Pro) deacylase
MPANKLKEFLDKNNVKYVTIKHSRGYTAQEIASSAHVSGKEFAKTIIIKIGEQMAMAVLPASYQIDFKQLSEALGTQNVTLATETEFMNHFPDCEVGAMPPFGHLYDMEVYVAEVLRKDKEITFNAGTHNELIRMSYEDYERLAEPKILKFSWKTVSFPKDPSERWKEDL